MAGLTEQQSRALQLDKHISLTANAGSGKTRVLVERYLNAVRDGVGVGEILCLTFTEKAALELRQKIGERISSEYKSAANKHLPAASILRAARETLLEANISTIHSFCAQVLREFPIEAGIDANFKVLEDFDSSSLKEDACADAVKELLARERDVASSRDERKVHTLLVKVGYGKVLALLVDLLHNREKIEHARLTGGRIILDEETLRQHWSSLARAVADVMQYNVSAKKGDLSEEIRALNAAAADSKSVAPVLAELKNSLGKILTNAGSPRKRDVVLEGGSKYSYEDALGILQTAFAALNDVVVENLSRETGDYLQELRTVVRLYEKSEELYGHRKYLMGALDFDDLQILAMRLITQSDNVKRTLVSRFRHIMVDEFQDTNFLQYGIFSALLDDFSSGSRLFVVGDPKQSIYRFRNAQVEVSQVAGERIASLDSGLSLPLSESFRMNSDIAGFVNEIFSRVLKGNSVFGAAGIRSNNQKEYDQLVPRRPQGGKDPVEIFIKSKGKGRLDDREGISDEVDAEMSSADAQALFVAARIRQMVSSPENIRSGKDQEREREVRYADIAILLRTRAKLKVLEDAMTKYGVPYVVSAGTGFYSAQEIFDLTNYLTFLLDNSADVPLLAVLRSPLFGISENELYAMSLVKGENLFERLLVFAGSTDAGNEVRYASSVLKDEIGLAQRDTIPQLINRILERTGWLGAYSLSPTADQRIANLRKLLGIAREFEGRGFNNLYDFVERIRYLKETAREGQAPAEEESDAVKIMTVHAAKGLEFPVVFVPFCDQTARRNLSMIVDSHVGILPFIGDDVPPSLSLYKQLESVHEHAEIARLFYVACTRAMDKLVLATSTKKSVSTMNSFTDILAKTIDLAEVPTDDHIECGGGRVKAYSSVPNVYPDKVSESPKEVELGDIFLGPVPANIDGEIYSASVLQTYRLCPTKYFLRYRLGMPVPERRDKVPESGNRRTESGNLEVNAGLPSPDSALRLDEYDDTILATVKGQLVHSVLEHVIRSGDTSGVAVQAAAGHAVSSMVEQALSDAARSGLIDAVAKNAGNALVTLSEIAGEGTRYTEQTITRRFDSDFLTGTLDLLIEDEKGYHIYDYKTNRLEKSREEIYEGYEIQMKLYASLCGNLKPGQHEIDVTILFTREVGAYLRRAYSRSDISEFEVEIREMLDGIKRLENEEGTFPSADRLPTLSPHCGECDYFVDKGGTKGCLLGKGRR